MKELREGLVLLVGVALGTAIAFSAVPALNPREPAPAIICQELLRTPARNVPGGFVVTLACAADVSEFVAPAPPPTAPPFPGATPGPIAPGLRV